MKIDKSKSPDRNRPWKDYGFDETKIDLTAGGKSAQRPKSHQPRTMPSKSQRATMKPNCSASET